MSSTRRIKTLFTSLKGIEKRGAPFEKLWLPVVQCLPQQSWMRIHLRGGKKEKEIFFCVLSVIQDIIFMCVWGRREVCIISKTNFNRWTSSNTHKNKYWHLKIHSQSCPSYSLREKWVAKKGKREAPCWLLAKQSFVAISHTSFFTGFGGSAGFGFPPFGRFASSFSCSSAKIFSLFASSWIIVASWNNWARSRALLPVFKKFNISVNHEN